jgi:ribosomal protein L37AE/L43A
MVNALRFHIAMADSSSPTHTTAALLDNEPDARRATCPLCHTPTSRDAIGAGGDWRCGRCGQRWDATRLATVAAYAAWTIDHDRAGRGTEGSHDAAL